MYTNVPGAETRDTVQKSTAYTREKAGGGFTHISGLIIRPSMGGIPYFIAFLGLGKEAHLRL